MIRSHGIYVPHPNFTASKMFVRDGQRPNGEPQEPLVGYSSDVFGPGHGSPGREQVKFYWESSSNDGFEVAMATFYVTLLSQ